MRTYSITYAQFESLLTFICIMTAEAGQIKGFSPDYIIDKYELYCGSAQAIVPSPIAQGGAHALVRERLIEGYLSHWGLTAANFAPAH